MKSVPLTLSLLFLLSLWLVFRFNTSQQRVLDLNNIGDRLSEQFLRKLAAVEDEKTLNIHIITHTHDDVGWRKTVDQYFYGWNDTIDNRGKVKDIIGNSVEALRQHPSRTFTYVEMKFFSMWWYNQTDQIKDQVRFLVANQQLVFVNGGWCMHDEAATHFMGMLDQTTLGHEFLAEELGVKPRIGWQLDPFGHSATQASLLSREFDAIYFGRIDYQDRLLRQLTRQCEGLWNSSSDSDTTLFWGLTGQYGGNYGCPKGFCFDRLCDDEPLVGASEERLRRRLYTFLELIRVEADETQGNNVMVTMGEDFTFAKAEQFYSNLDVLIGTIMSYQHWGIIDIEAIFGPKYDHVNIFYSTPEYYTDVKYVETSRARESGASEKAEPDWQVKQDDFFPYSDCPHCFWTGYFTSRTAFKRFERVCSSFLMAARQIHTLWGGNVSCNCPLEELEDALGIAQHHDAVSGTAKQHVSDDYSLRLQQGLDVASDLVTTVLKRSLDNNIKGVLANLQYCERLNETICQISEQATQIKGTDVYVVVYNPKSSEQSSVIRVPVSSNATYAVKRLGDGNLQPELVLPTTAAPLHTSKPGKFVVMIDTGKLPPLGTSVYRISMDSPVDTEHSENGKSWASTTGQRTRVLSDEMNFVATNDLIEVSFDKDTGMLKQVSALGVNLNVSQDIGYYTSFDRDIDPTHVPHDQNSGAYIFRPSEPEQPLTTVDAKPNGATFVNTSVGLEVHVSFNEPWIRQVTRVLTGQPYVEIEYTVGPVPVHDGRGREVVIRYNAPAIENEARFYTDSNGREFLQRKRNFRPTWSMEVMEPIAGNYYPVNAGIYIEDGHAAMTILTDRSQGGGSIKDGSLELMVQRRTVADDSRGVDEPMNETDGGMTPYPPYGQAFRMGEGVVIRGIHRLYVGKSGASLARSGMYLW